MFLTQNKDIVTIVTFVRAIFVTVANVATFEVHCISTPGWQESCQEALNPQRSYEQKSHIFVAILRYDQKSRTFIKELYQKPSGVFHPISKFVLRHHRAKFPPCYFCPGGDSCQLNLGWFKKELQKITLSWLYGSLMTQFSIKNIYGLQTLYFA